MIPKERSMQERPGGNGLRKFKVERRKWVERWEKGVGSFCSG